MDVGKRIREIRQKAGVSQSELAAILGMSKAQLSQYETGRRVPKKETIDRMTYIIDGTFEDKTDEESASPVLLKKLEVLLGGFEDLQNDAYIDPFFYKSWDEMDDVIKEQFEERKNERPLLEHFRLLNSTGQEKVVLYAEDLSTIPQYQAAPPEPAEE